VDIEDLDPAVLNELRTLPEELRDKVAAHLAAAELFLLDEDDATARLHTKAAKKLAGRVAAVREADGIAAYRCGDYADALAELRAVRRMTGNDSFVPMMADCERGLGRPERALELLREVRDGDPALRVESQIVAAGARADMGQPEAALVLLEIPELTSLPPGTERARLQYAYASALETLGRSDDAAEWYAKAAQSDIEGELETP
jgi:predicted Zn-dependent protease